LHWLELLLAPPAPVLLGSTVTPRGGAWGAACPTSLDMGMG